MFAQLRQLQLSFSLHKTMIKIEFIFRLRKAFHFLLRLVNETNKKAAFNKVSTSIFFVNHSSDNFNYNSACCFISID